MANDAKSEFERLNGMGTAELLREIAAKVEKENEANDLGRALGLAMSAADLGAAVRLALDKGIGMTCRGTMEMMGPIGPRGSATAVMVTMAGADGGPQDEYLLVTSATEEASGKPGVAADPLQAIRVSVYRKQMQFSDLAGLAAVGRKAADLDESNIGHRPTYIRDGEPLIGHALIALAGTGRKIADRVGVRSVEIARIVPGDCHSGYCLVVDATPGVTVPEAVTVEADGETVSVPIRLKV